MSMHDSVVQKIQKLLALANGNQNEHEREVAMQFAMDLLAKHNLSIAQVQGTVTGISVDEVRVDIRLDPWVRVILSAVCKLYYTDYYMFAERDWYTGRKHYTPVFVGTRENISVTIDVAFWLMDSIRRESNRKYKEQYERRSFRLGAARRIFDRAEEMVRAEKNSAAGVTAGTTLMVIRNQLEKANENHLANLKLSSFRSRGTYLDEDAYDDGTVYGDQVRLGKQPKGLPQYAGTK